MKETEEQRKIRERKVDIMCRAFEEVRDEAREQGRVEGRVEGRAEGRVEGIEQERIKNIQNLMESMKLTAQQAMDALMIPVSEQQKYTAILSL